MATTIRWIDNSSVEQGHRIYKSDTYFTKDNLPPMLVELGPDVEEYVDEDGEDGENWYIVSAFIAGYEVFSEPFIGGLSIALVHDIFSDGSAVATYDLYYSGTPLDLSGDNSIDEIIGEYEQGDGFYNLYGFAGGRSRIDASFDRDVIAVSLWFKMLELNGTSYQKIADFRYGSGSDFYSINGNSGNFNGGNLFNVHINGIPTTQPEDAFDGEWNHVYFETTPTNGITFGSRHASTDYAGNGVFRFIRCLSRPLTETEIELLYNDGKKYL